MTKEPPAGTPIGEVMQPIINAMEADLAKGDDFWREREARIAEADEAERQKGITAARVLRDRRWRAIPAEYREEFDPAKSKMPPDVIKAVKRWLPESGEGIGLVGRSGLTKTRLLVRAVLHRLECSWIFVPATKFAESVRRQYNDNYRVANEAAEVLDACKSVRVLMLDDVGQESPTEAVSEALLDVLEFRTTRRKPILWTSNHDSAVLMRRHKDRGEAIVRRLQEFCWMPSGEEDQSNNEA